MFTITEIRTIVRSIESPYAYFLELSLDLHVNYYKIHTNSFPETVLSARGKHIVELIIHTNDVRVNYENGTTIESKPKPAELILESQLQHASLKTKCMEQIIQLVENEEQFMDFKLPLLLLCHNHMD